MLGALIMRSPQREGSVSKSWKLQDKVKTHKNAMGKEAAKIEGMKKG